MAVESATRALGEATHALCAAWPSTLARDRARGALQTALRIYFAALADVGIRGPLARNGATLTVRHIASQAAASAGTDVVDAVVREAVALIAQH